jgi:acyl-CoA thioester hydrolase
MPRIQIDLPEPFHFITQISIRISDVNYGGHAGNDTILSLAHEARVQFLKKAAYGELDIEGVGLIITDAAIEYKSELFYGETVLVSVKATNFSKAAFDIFYKMEKENSNERKLVAKIKTGMLGYDYNKKKIVAIPENAVKKIESL